MKPLVLSDKTQLEVEDSSTFAEPEPVDPILEATNAEEDK